MIRLEAIKSSLTTFHIYNEPNWITSRVLLFNTFRMFSIKVIGAGPGRAFDRPPSSTEFSKWYR